MLAIESLTHFNSAVLAHEKQASLVHFSANWCDPCKQIDGVMLELTRSFPGLFLAKVEAEDIGDVTEKYEIESVPTCILFFKGKPQFRVDGANPAELSKKVTEFFRENPTAAAATTPATSSSATTTPQLDAASVSRLKSLINASPVMLFMKGSPDEPKCGFSRQIVQLLRDQKVIFQHFDILGDDSVRQGLKIFSDWPTYPQLYVSGELVGGVDIVRSQIEDGSFASLVPDSARQDKLEERLKHLTHSHPVMLFMKGSPDAPRCGFSRQAVSTLRSEKVNFGFFDILSDVGVREGLKKYSDWPTYPQIYIEGELIGGLDILREMVDSGEFASKVPASAKLE